MPRLLALIFAVVSFGQLHSAVKAQIEDLAARLPCLDTGDLLWNRLADISPASISASDEAPYRRGVAELIALQAGEADLLPLLKHPDPKVRTLAMAKLLLNDDAHALPAIAALAHDPAPTFPNPQPPPPTPQQSAAVANGIAPESGLGPTPKDQTVGSIAEAIVDFYLQAGGYDRGIDGTPGFSAYWKTHKDRDHCASWFLVQLTRAIHGTSPIPAASADAIRQVRARVDRLPQSDRDWTLLFLCHSWRGDPNDPDSLENAFVTSDEMIQIGRRLGPANLVSALRRDIPCDDPDMQSGDMGMPGSENSGTAMRLFILHHATQLLRPQDADALLAQGQAELAHENGLISAWWAIAAAHLQPARAAAILHADLRFLGSPKRASDDGYDQVDAGATLWQMEGPSETEFLTDWFYTDLIKKNGHMNPSACSKFIDAIASSGRPLLAKIAADPRYPVMDPYATMSLASAANRWSPKPIVTNEEIRDLYGQPPKDYVLRLLERIHQSVPTWQK